MFRDKLDVDVCELAEKAGIVEICESNVVCKDSDEDARRDYTVTIVGFDCNGKKKRIYFSLTAWEEITHDEKV